jgi:hypothetical protein
VCTCVASCPLGQHEVASGGNALLLGSRWPDASQEVIRHRDHGGPLAMILILLMAYLLYPPNPTFRTREHVSYVPFVPLSATIDSKRRAHNDSISRTYTTRRPCYKCLRLRTFWHLLLESVMTLCRLMHLDRRMKGRESERTLGCVHPASSSPRPRFPHDGLCPHKDRSVRIFPQNP